MADRIIDSPINDVPALPEELNHVLVFALNEGRDALKENKVFDPFTVLMIGGKPFARQHPGDTPEECYALAQHEVQGARGAQAYALCYDGYIDTNEGTKDAIISEGGVPGEATGHAIGYLYTINEDGSVSVSTTPSYIGKAPNFMKGLTKEDPMAEENKNPEDINTIENGEELEYDVAVDFDEPVKED